MPAIPAAAAPTPSIDPNAGAWATPVALPDAPSLPADLAAKTLATITQTPNLQQEPDATPSYTVTAAPAGSTYTMQASSLQHALASAQLVTMSELPAAGVVQAGDGAYWVTALNDPSGKNSNGVAVDDGFNGRANITVASHDPALKYIVGGNTLVDLTGAAPNATQLTPLTLDSTLQGIPAATTRYHDNGATTWSTSEVSDIGQIAPLGNEADAQATAALMGRGLGAAGVVSLANGQYGVANLADPSAPPTGWLITDNGEQNRTDIGVQALTPALKTVYGSGTRTDLGS